MGSMDFGNGMSIDTSFPPQQQQPLPPQLQQQAPPLCAPAPSTARKSRGGLRPRKSVTTRPRVPPTPAASDGSFADAHGDADRDRDEYDSAGLANSDEDGPTPSQQLVDGMLELSVANGGRQGLAIHGQALGTGPGPGTGSGLAQSQGSGGGGDRELMLSSQESFTLGHVPSSWGVSDEEDEAGMGGSRRRNSSGRRRASSLGSTGGTGRGRGESSEGSGSGGE